VVALVGYTNVGKSALMNALMKKKEVESKDLLFQTLTTTSRQYFLNIFSIQIPSGTKIMLLDTIGFITNLPIELVESFKTTL
jgi:GTP-binding protein HflX